MTGAHRAFKGVLLSFIPFSVLYAVSSLCAVTFSTKGLVATSLSELCAIFCAVCCASFLLSRCERVKSDFAEEENIAERACPLPILALAVTIGVALLFGMNLVYSFLSPASSTPEAESLVLRIVFTVVLIPIGEEIFFRYMIPKILMSEEVSKTFVILTSAALFTLIHGFAMMPFALFAGVLLGVQATLIGGVRGIVCACLTHSLYNGILVILLFV